MIIKELPILVCFAILLFYFIHRGVKDIRIMIERSKVTIKDEVSPSIFFGLFDTSTTLYIVIF